MDRTNRLPDFKDYPKDPANPWGSQLDNITVLVHDMGKRCAGECKRVIVLAHLRIKNGAYYCPDCFEK